MEYIKQLDTTIGNFLLQDSDAEAERYKIIKEVTNIKNTYETIDNSNLKIQAINNRIDNLKPSGASDIFYTGVDIYPNKDSSTTSRTRVSICRNDKCEIYIYNPGANTQILPNNIKISSYDNSAYNDISISKIEMYKNDGTLGAVLKPSQLTLKASTEDAILSAVYSELYKKVIFSSNTHINTKGDVVALVDDKSYSLSDIGSKALLLNEDNRYIINGNNYLIAQTYYTISSDYNDTIPFAGSIDTDALSLDNYKSGFYTVFDGSSWWAKISCRHRNGSGDGSSYGFSISTHLTNSGQDLKWQHQNSSGWEAERTILDSSNYTNYIGASGNYLPLSGGTLTGNLRLNAGILGSKLNFGEGENLYLCEDDDDHLTIYARAGVDINTDSSNVNVNGGFLITHSNIDAYAVTARNVSSYAVTPSNISSYALPKSGGTITGDLQLKKTDSNFGSKLSFGDSEFVYLCEDTDDHLVIYGRSGIDINTLNSDGVKANGASLITTNNISTYAITASNISSYALPISGGTITGNLKIKGANAYGTKLNFGDGDYVYLYEDTDDHLVIYAKSGIDINTSGTSVKINNNALITTGNISSYAISSSGGTVNGAITFGGNDSYGIYTSSSNFCCIGTESNYFYKSYANYVYYKNLATISDKRKKYYIQDTPIEESVTLLDKTPIRQYTYIEDKDQIVNNGVFAQDVRDVMLKYDIQYRPYISIEYPNSKDRNVIKDLNTPEQDVEYYIDYTKFIPELWNGWKYNHNEIGTLKQEIADLKKQLENLLQ